MDDLRAHGGTAVNTPADAAKDVDCVIMSLPNSSIAREAAIGPNGISEGANSKNLYVCDTTTSRPEDSISLSAELEKKGIKLSLKKAENADLKLVVVDAKSIDLSGFLNDLLKNNAILVVNKSDLLKQKLDPEISKLNHDSLQKLLE